MSVEKAIKQGDFIKIKDLNNLRGKYKEVYLFLGKKDKREVVIKTEANIGLLRIFIDDDKNIKFISKNVNRLSLSSPGFQSKNLHLDFKESNLWKIYLTDLNNVFLQGNDIREMILTDVFSLEMNDFNIYEAKLRRGNVDFNKIKNVEYMILSDTLHKSILISNESHPNLKKIALSSHQVDTIELNHVELEHLFFIALKKTVNFKTSSQNLVMKILERRTIFLTDDETTRLCLERNKVPYEYTEDSLLKSL